MKLPRLVQGLKKIFIQQSPVHLFPSILKPSLQLHLYEPSIFVQIEFSSHVLFDMHSLMSIKNATHIFYILDRSDKIEKKSDKKARIFST